MKQRQVAVLCWLATIDAGLVLAAKSLSLAIVLVIATAVAVGLAGGD